VIRSLVLREALVAARKPALVAIAIVSATTLALFPVAWGARGMPTLDGASLYDQQFRLEWMLMLMLLPWTAARIIASEQADGLAALSVATASSPSRILLARLLAIAAAVMLVVAAALPIAVSAQQMSAIPLNRAIADQLALIGFALPVSVVTLWWMQTTVNRLLGWLGSAATVVLLLLLARAAVATMDQASLLLAVFTLPAALVLLKKADTWWRYLSEQPA
jgi:hypothetical protein